MELRKERMKKRTLSKMGEMTGYGCVMKMIGPRKQTDNVGGSGDGPE